MGKTRKHSLTIKKILTALSRKDGTDWQTGMPWRQMRVTSFDLYEGIPAKTAWSFVKPRNSFGAGTANICEQICKFAGRWTGKLALVSI